MQASTALKQPKDALEHAELTQQLAAFVHYVMKTCGRDFLQAVDDLGLSLSQLKAVQVLLLTDSPEMSLKEIGDHLGLSLPAISRAVDGLVQRGLVTRTEDTVDRRIKRVRATEAGRALFDELQASRLSNLDQIVEMFGPRARAQLARALAPLVEREEIAALMPRRS